MAKKKAATPPEIKVTVSHRVEHILDIERAVNENVPIVIFEIEHIPNIIVPITSEAVLHMQENFDEVCARVFKSFVIRAVIKAVEATIALPPPALKGGELSENGK